mmetsp:Transcript_27645/g.50036  ORF Transcript_27645/g.50036 Transcript_27645/m.50036 type:complete len:89 (-) Transcript_27645:280-546(-)
MPVAKSSLRVSPANYSATKNSSLPKLSFCQGLRLENAPRGLKVTIYDSTRRLSNGTVQARPSLQMKKLARSEFAQQQVSHARSRSKFG